MSPVNHDASENDDPHQWIDSCTPRTGLLLVCLSAALVLAGLWNLF